MADVIVGAKLSLDAGDGIRSMKEFKQQLKDAQGEVLAMTEKFGQTSIEAQTAAKRVAELKDRIGDANKLADAFNPDQKFRALSQSLGGVLGGFTALQGAMGLLGVESEDVQKQLLKVQSALAISQGLNQLGEAINSFKTLASTIGGVVAGAFKTLKGAIAASGIGLLITAIITAIVYFKNLADAAEEAAAAEKEALEARERSAEAGLTGEENFINRQKELAIAKAKNQGKSDAEIYKIQRNFEEQRLRSLQRFINDVGEYSEKGTEAKLRIIDIEAKMEIDRLNFETDQNKKRLDARKKFLEDQKKLEESRPGKFEGLNEEDLTDPSRRKFDTTKEQDDLIKAKIDAQIKQTEIEKEQAAERIRIADEETKAKIQFHQDLANSLGALADLIGRQTAAGKVLAIAQATINTWLGVTEVLKAKSVLPEPQATINKIINVAAIVATGLNAIKNIVRTPVPGGGGSGGGTNVSAPLSPQVATTVLNQQQLNQIGNATNRAFVVETDMTTNQERVRRLNRAARIG